MYCNALTMTVTVILNACSSLKEKQDDRYHQPSTWQAQNVLTASATSTGSYNVWNIDLQRVRTRCHGSMIFLKNAANSLLSSLKSLAEAETIRVLAQNCILCVGHSFDVCNNRQSVGECWIYI
jgi:hypothetical protein